MTEQLQFVQVLLFQLGTASCDTFIVASTSASRDVESSYTFLLAAARTPSPALPLQVTELSVAPSYLQLLTYFSSTLKPLLKTSSASSLLSSYSLSIYSCSFPSYNSLDVIPAIFVPVSQSIYLHRCFRFLE